MPRRMLQKGQATQVQNGQGARGYGIYGIQSGQGTWLFPPNGNAGANSYSSSDGRPVPLPAFFVSAAVFLVQLKPQDPWGFFSPEARPG
jgi:hypothetical protein